MIAVISILGMVMAVLIYRSESRLTVNDINKHLFMDEIKLGMPEADLIQHWGNGEYEEGFGGHKRTYKDKQIAFGIAGDSDNDFYRKIGQFEFTNPRYRLYGIRIGDSFVKGAEQLEKFGYKYDGELFSKDEFVIALRGESTIDSIQLWFTDKDLRDRQY